MTFHDFAPRLSVCLSNMCAREPQRNSREILAPDCFITFMQFYCPRVARYVHARCTFPGKNLQRVKIEIRKELPDLRPTFHSCRWLGAWNFTSIAFVDHSRDVLVFRWSVSRLRLSVRYLISRAKYACNFAAFRFQIDFKFAQYNLRV